MVIVDVLAWMALTMPLTLAVYAYILYPILLWVTTRRRLRAEPRPMLEWPTVSVVVPAYNEERQIRGAIEALLAQDYPSDKKQIVVVSDASTDGTDAIVREYAHRGVELVRMPQRSGKTAAENASSRLLRGTIIINTDASIRMHPAAVGELARSMRDPEVGVASTRDVSVGAASVAGNLTEAGYVGYEMWVRALETKAGGIVGASGSGYAIRSELHRIPIRDDLSRDFSAALTSRRHDLRAVSVESAVCFVPRTTSLQREYLRKVRTIARGIDTLYYNRSLLNPMAYGSFAWKLLSHKIGRWMVSLSTVPALLALGWLATEHAVLAVALLAVGATGAVALVGALWPSSREMPRLVSVIAFGVAANIAVVHAFWRAIRGHQDHMWEPTRRTPHAAET